MESVLKELKKAVKLAKRENKKIVVEGPYYSTEVPEKNVRDLWRAVWGVWPFVEGVDLCVDWSVRGDKVVVEVWTPHM